MWLRVSQPTRSGDPCFTGPSLSMALLVAAPFLIAGLGFFQALPFLFSLFLLTVRFFFSSECFAGCDQIRFSVALDQFSLS